MSLPDEVIADAFAESAFGGSNIRSRFAGKQLAKVIHRKLLEAGYVIVPATSQLLERGKEVKLHE